MSKSEDLLNLRIALAEQQKLAHAKDEEGGSKEGGSSSTGQGGAVVEMHLFIETFSLIRNGEKQFGAINDFDPLAYLAKTQRSSLNGEIGASNQLKSHPILSKLSKFDGDTPNMSMDPKKNEAAQNRLENRLQLQMAMKNRPQITPKPGGM
ncbi:MAG: hypothetical protein K0S08_860 [Gammaproteobacteria bacterium]|jgi:hypothetical protein|nr:hypothetical protein [Gammaproteobacteria bacterium]